MAKEDVKRFNRNTMLRISGLQDSIQTPWHSPQASDNFPLIPQCSRLLSCHSTQCTPCPLAIKSHSLQSHQAFPQGQASACSALCLKYSFSSSQPAKHLSTQVEVVKCCFLHETRTFSGSEELPPLDSWGHSAQTLSFGAMISINFTHLLL